MSEPVTIVVADDHHLFRAGLIELLNSVAGFKVVGDGASGDDAIQLSSELRPSVVTLDVSMPGPGAPDTVRQILEVSPDTRILVLTMFDDPRLIREVINAGASSYLLKTSNRSELATGVRSALAPDDVIMIAVSRPTFLGLVQTAPVDNDVVSSREYEVLQLLAAAKSNRDIGRALNISEATVKRHLSNVYAKLGAKSRMDALLAARRTGLLPD